ncbi:MAG: NUDIX hydrolase [Alphaproteobacteria bacterium]|nr:NUDIX hydrolase [Alphaproteobacteria bacterium]
MPSYTYSYPRPSVTVDLVVFTILDNDLKVLLIRRGQPPFEGCPALPGGFVLAGTGGDDRGEDLEVAARRELAEETGLPEGSVYLEQLYTFGAADRDPRGRVITVAWYALVRPTLAPLVMAGGDAAEAGWRSLTEVDPDSLAFDHGRILRCALERIRGKVDYSDIAFELVPETFTVTELRSVHEVIKGTAYDPANFRRRFKRMQTDGVIEQAPGRRTTGARRARVYRFVGRG